MVPPSPGANKFKTEVGNAASYDSSLLCSMRWWNWVPCIRGAAAGDASSQENVVSWAKPSNIFLGEEREMEQLQKLYKLVPACRQLTPTIKIPRQIKKLLGFDDNTSPKFLVSMLTTIREHHPDRRQPHPVDSDRLLPGGVAGGGEGLLSSAGEVIGRAIKSTDTETEALEAARLVYGMMGSSADRGIAVELDDAASSKPLIFVPAAGHQKSSSRWKCWLRPTEVCWKLQSSLTGLASILPPAISSFYVSNRRAAKMLQETLKVRATPSLWDMVNAWSAAVTTTRHDLRLGELAAISSDFSVEDLKVYYACSDVCLRAAFVGLLHPGSFCCL